MAGQAAALWAVVTAGVLGTFVMAAGRSLVIWSFGRAVPPGAGTMPPVGTVAPRLGVTVLVGAAYGTAGLVLEPGPQRRRGGRWPAWYGPRSLRRHG